MEEFFVNRDSPNSLFTTDLLSITNAILPVLQAEFRYGQKTVIYFTKSAAADNQKCNIIVVR